ncbi:hypothetical protein [Sphingobacterium sp. NPDC055431]
MKNHLIKFIVLIVFVLPTNNFAQTFKVFYLQPRYEKSEIDYLKNNTLYHKYFWLGQSVFFPKGDNNFDVNSVKKRLELFFPDVNDNSYVSIDIEGKIIQDLNSGKPGDEKFDKSEAIFIKAINVIKSFRPNLKVGIYGLPSRVYYQNHYKGDDSKLIPILEKCDYISPSLYVVYADSDKGSVKNDEYFKFNLQRSLVLAKRLNKELVPYVWPVIHGNSSKHGGKLVDVTAMKRYLNIIKSYSYQGKSANGVLWWEEPVNSKYSIKKIQSNGFNTRSLNSSSKSASNPGKVLIESTQGL